MSTFTIQDPALRRMVGIGGYYPRRLPAVIGDYEEYPEDGPGDYPEMDPDYPTAPATPADSGDSMGTEPPVAGPDSTMQPGRPAQDSAKKKTGLMRRLLPVIGEMAMGFADGAAIPNIARGGGTDAMRAIQAGMQGKQARDYQSHQMARQVQADAEMANYRRAQAEADRARAAGTAATSQNYWASQARQADANRIREQAGLTGQINAILDKGLGRIVAPDEQLTPEQQRQVQQFGNGVSVYRFSEPELEERDVKMGRKVRIAIPPDQREFYGGRDSMTVTAQEARERYDKLHPAAPKETNPTEWSVLRDAAGGDPNKMLTLWKQQHPKDTSGEQRPAPHAVFAGIETKKQTALRNAEAQFRERLDASKYRPNTTIEASEEDQARAVARAQAQLNRDKAQVQDAYESEILAAGGSIAASGPTLPARSQSVGAPRGARQMAQPQVSTIPQRFPVGTVRYKGGVAYKFDGREWIAQGN